MPEVKSKVLKNYYRQDRCRVKGAQGTAVVTNGRPQLLFLQGNIMGAILWNNILFNEL